MINLMRKRFGDAYWLKEDNLGPIPNGDGTFRKGPSMSKIYVNAHNLFHLILLADFITTVAWITVIWWLINQADSSKADYVYVVAFNVIGLSIISVVCWAMTLLGVRSERLILVARYEEIDGNPIMGFHVDLPEIDQGFEQEDFAPEPEPSRPFNPIQEERV